jgi:acyl-coenzyme A thioesterase PaaI-like protein
VDIETFLDARRAAPGDWTFGLPTEFHGAFGGAFGGLIAACGIYASRDLAPGRTPVAADYRFLRGLPAGRARVCASVVRAGRSLSCISVDVLDETGGLAAQALVSFVDAGALKHVVRAGPSKPGGWAPFDTAEPWPPVAPIVSTLAARTLGSGADGIATGVRVPWETAGSAEAACLAGDMSVGAPLGYAMAGERVSTPNPDLSLRFCGDVTTDHVVGLARTERADGGVAVVRIGVWSGDELVAIGVSSALLLG